MCVCGGGGGFRRNNSSKKPTLNKYVRMQFYYYCKKDYVCACHAVFAPPTTVLVPPGLKRQITQVPKRFRPAKNAPLGICRSRAIAVNRMIETGRNQTKLKAI